LSVQQNQEAVKPDRALYPQENASDIFSWEERREQLSEFHKKILAYLVSLNPEEAEIFLRRSEEYFRDTLEGEILEVGLMFLKLVRIDFMQGKAAG